MISGRKSSSCNGLLLGSNVDQLVNYEYDAGTDVAGFFSEEFRKYVREQDLLCRRSKWSILVWAWIFRKKLHVYDVDLSYQVIEDQIINAFQNRDFDRNLLIQFWKAKEVSSGIVFDQKYFLVTTKDQPFVVVGDIRSLQEMNKLCAYRARMANINDGHGGTHRGGVINRVFTNKRMEFTPNVAYYSSEEYPNRDLALSCHIKPSLVLPLSDSSGRSLGVVEIVSLEGRSTLFLELNLIKSAPFQTLQKDVFGCCRGYCGNYGKEDNFLHHVAEIKGVMEVVHKSCSAVLGRTWMLCQLCNSLSTCEKFGANLGASFTGKMSDFAVAESNFILKMGEGVVGKAASSPYDLVYCEDVSKLGIIEYPLAHFARQYNISSCCAISLHCVHTGDQVYVLEFFLDPSRDLWADLLSLVQALRQNFRTYKLASGKQIGGTLSIQVIDASSPDKIAILENRELELSLAIGLNNVEVVKPYFLQGSIGETSVYETDDLMTRTETSSQDISMDEAPLESFSTIRSEFRMTVKAYYGDSFVTFQLSDSSGIDALKEQVSQRFNLESGTYIIKYQDDTNDPVLIECDEDVHEYISCSTSLGEYVLSIALKNSS